MASSDSQFEDFPNIDDSLEHSSHDGYPKSFPLGPRNSDPVLPSTNSRHATPRRWASESSDPMEYKVELQEMPVIEKSMRPREGSNRRGSIFGTSTNDAPEFSPVAYLPSRVQDPGVARAKKRGNAALQKKDYREAVTAYTEAIDQDPGMRYPKLYFRRGVALENLGLLSRAVTDYAIAFNLTAGTTAFEAYEKLHNRIHAAALPAFIEGENALAQDRYHLAISYFTRAIEADPTYGPAYLKRGLGFEQLGEHLIALKDFVKADNRCDVINLRGMCRKAAARVEEKLFEAALPTKRRADIAFDGQAWKTAIREYSSAIKKAPEYGALWFHRGLAYEEFGDLGRAMADLIHAQTLLDRPDAVQQNIEAMERIQRKQHKGAIFAKNRGDLQFGTYNWIKASWWYTRAIKQDPLFAEAYFCRGLCREALGKFDKAERDICRAQELFKREDFLENCSNALSRIERLRAGQVLLPTSSLTSSLVTPAMLTRRRVELFQIPRAFTFPELTPDFAQGLGWADSPLNASRKGGKEPLIPLPSTTPRGKARQSEQSFTNSPRHNSSIEGKSQKFQPSSHTKATRKENQNVHH
eukprot:g26449.t1